MCLRVVGEVPCKTFVRISVKARPLDAGQWKVMFYSLVTTAGEYLGIKGFTFIKKS